VGARTLKEVETAEQGEGPPNRSCKLQGVFSVDMGNPTLGRGERVGRPIISRGVQEVKEKKPGQRDG